MPERSFAEASSTRTCGRDELSGEAQRHVQQPTSSYPLYGSPGLRDLPLGDGTTPSWKYWDKASDT